MTQLVEHADVPVLAAPGRRRSALPWLTALLVLAGLFGSLVLSAPRFASFPRLQPSVVGAPFVTVPEYGVRGGDILGYEDRAVIRMSLPLHNSGRLPVTVTSLSLGGGPAPLLAVRSITGLPVTLWPGRSADIAVTAELTNCKFFHEREMQTYDDLRVEGRSMGRSFVRDVGFVRPIYLKSPMIVGCPDRKLNRQANNRTDLM